tara:strand:+ start:170 stop:928 length:759 start_codon:yes stop_codon:yes gene_type:complete
MGMVSDVAEISLGRQIGDWKVRVGAKRMFLWGSPPTAQIGIVKEMISKDKFKKLFIGDMNNHIKEYKDWSKNNWKDLRSGRDEKEWKEAVRDFKKVIAIGEQLKRDAQKDPLNAFIKLQKLRDRGFGMPDSWGNSYDLITADKTMSYIASLGDKKAKKMRLEKDKKTTTKKKAITKRKTTVKKTTTTKRKSPAKKKVTPKRKAPAKKKTATKKRKSPAKKGATPKCKSYGKLKTPTKTGRVCKKKPGKRAKR